MSGGVDPLRTRRWLWAGVGLFGLATVIGVVGLLLPWPARPPSPSPEPVASAPSPSTSPTPAATPVRSPSPSLTGRYESRFVPTGSMIQARRLDEATVTGLLDGRVLVAGGVIGDGSTASAEVYDPDRGVWQLTAPLPRPTRGATATLLVDGRVLVAGGMGSAAADLYDPTTGTWSPTGAMPAVRSGAVAARLPDGRVLVTGGDGEGANGQPILASATVYDPAIGTWSVTGSMTTSRSHAAIAALQDGRVLIIGGGTIVRDALVETFLSSAEVYDPHTGAFTKTGSMAESHWIPNATLLADGRVLVVGGRDPHGNDVARAELYDPAAGRFQATGPMTVPRFYAATVLLADGRVLVVGGSFIASDNPADAEWYEPRTGTFSLTGSLNVHRDGPALVRLADGRVLVVGGSPKGPAPGDWVGSTEVFQ